MSCYRCYRSSHWSDMFSSNLCTDLFQSQLRSFLRPCWGHIEVIFHEMNQPAIWGSPIFPDLSIKFLMSRLQRPVQTTAGSDVESGHLQIAEVRWHRHWDKTPKEHLKKTWFFIDQWLLIYQIYTWLWSTVTDTDDGSRTWTQPFQVGSTDPGDTLTLRNPKQHYDLDGRPHGETDGTCQE